MENQQENKDETGIKLDRKSKILFAVIAVLVVGSVAATFWRIVVKRDYIVQAQIDCDPSEENCFVWECDPNSTDEWEACTGDPEEDIWYYEILNRNAKNIPDCDPNDEDCTAYICGEDEADCSYELCTEDNVPEGETCNDPEQYNIDNSPEEDSEECAPDDEECLSEEESAEEECAPDDQECLDAQESEDAEECAPDDQECLDAQSSAQDSEETCPPDDPNCEQGDNADSTASQPETNSDNSEAVPLPL